MTDAELTLRAALAAGAKPYDWDTCGDGLFIRDGVPVWLAGGDHDADFDPLNNDAEAFRLMVRLSIDVFPNQITVIAISNGRYTEDCNGRHDRAAATRRAIVRAAAGMGQ